MKDYIVCVWMMMSLTGDSMNNNSLYVLGAGFACMDIIKYENQDVVMLGGTAANVITILSQLGAQTEFLMVRHTGLEGKWLDSAFHKRNISCIYYASTQKKIPKIIEKIDNGDHSFISTCPYCGEDLLKVCLPNMDQIKRLSDRIRKKRNVFFYDRITNGIKECIRMNVNGWNMYEPNSCRIYNNLLGGAKLSNIVKFSEDRISEKITEKLILDLQNSNVHLIIVTMGERGLKYKYRALEKKFSDWYYIPVGNREFVIDSSGSGDWLTAIFLYLFLKKYPKYTESLDGKCLYEMFFKAQKIAVMNCAYVGAQGMLKNRKIIKMINDELDATINYVKDEIPNWKEKCFYCHCESKL